MFKKNAVILFQRDSITDAGRNHDNSKINLACGQGYMYIVASRLGVNFPELDLRFYNRGCNGHRVVDLYARWKEDVINLSPDILSILIGINGINRDLSKNEGVSSDRYEKIYRLLMEETLLGLPNVRFVLCEPFALPVALRKERWSDYKRELDLRRDIVFSLAEEFNAILVKTQDMFDRACQLAPPEYWIWDGIHPTPAGHGLIAKAWLEAVGDNLYEEGK